MAPRKKEERKRVGPTPQPPSSRSFQPTSRKQICLARAEARAMQTVGTWTQIVAWLRQQMEPSMSSLGGRYEVLAVLFSDRGERNGRRNPTAEPYGHECVEWGSRRKKGANERTGSPTRRYLSTQPARLQEAPNGVNAKPVTQLQYAVLRTSSTRYTVLLLP